MGLTAFFLDDALSDPRDPIVIVGSAMATTNPHAPVRNALNDQPRVVWMNAKGVWAPSGVSAGNYDTYIDIEEGGGGSDYSTTIFALTAWTASQFASYVEGRLNANASLSLTYTVIHHPSSSRFQISASGSFEIKWKTGTHGSDNQDDHIGPWMGFSDTADSAAGTSHTGSPRYDTELSVVLQGNQQTTAMAANLWATILHGDDSFHSSGGSDFSDVKVYGHTSNLGFNRGNWENKADFKLTFSPRPAEDQNYLQIAYNSGGGAMTKDYWFFSWRYFDQSKNHSCGILKALDTFTTTDRQITELANHGLVDPTTPLGIKSYYPVQNLLRWRTPLNFNSWGAADYRNVVQEVVRRGRARGLVWALRWDEILDGTYDAEDEADKGFLLYAALQGYSQESYAGRGSSEFISGELTIEQVR